MWKKIFGVMMLIMLVVALCFCVEASACTCTCNCSCCCAGSESTESTATRILDACQEVTNTFINREAYYSIDEDLVWDDIAKSYNADGICSTTYVSLVLYVSGLFTEEQINAYNYNWSGKGGLSSMLQDAGWIQVDSANIQPGDIAINPGSHAMIYAGNYTFYDQDTCVGPKTRNPIQRNDFLGWNVYRAPEK